MVAVVVVDRAGCDRRNAGAVDLGGADVRLSGLGAIIGAGEGTGTGTCVGWLYNAD